MKRALYIITLLAVRTVAYFGGATGTENTIEAASQTESQIESIPDGYIDMDSNEFRTDDGCGYYLEAEHVK